MAHTTDNKPFVIKRISIFGDGVVGPPGPPGPKGDDGDSVQLPIDSDDVLYNSQTLTSILDSLTYVAIDITSLTNTINKLEVGSTLSSLGLNWTLNHSDIISQTITGTNISSTSVPIADRSEVLTGINFTPTDVSSAFYTLSVDDGTNVDAEITEVAFLNRRYWASLPSGTINDAFILSMQKDTIAQMQNNRNKTFTVDTGNGSVEDKYVWFAYPSRLGLATFKDAETGFDAGMEDPVTHSFTNASGFTEDYYVYRSTNPNLGQLTIIVS